MCPPEAPIPLTLSPLRVSLCCACLRLERCVGPGSASCRLAKNVNVNEQSARKHMRITIHARMLLVLLLLDDHIRRRVYELLYE